MIKTQTNKVSTFGLTQAAKIVLPANDRRIAVTFWGWSSNGVTSWNFGSPPKDAFTGMPLWNGFSGIPIIHTFSIADIGTAIQEPIYAWFQTPEDTFHAIEFLAAP